MTTPHHTPEEPDTPREDAAWWFARMQSGETTEQDQQAFEAWLRADPEHERQYRNMAYLWDATLDVPEQRLKKLLEAPPEKAPGWFGSVFQFGRRRWALQLTLACAVLIGIGLTVQQASPGPPQQTIRLETAKGERRQVTLPDGSVLDLNTSTRATVVLYQAKRLVELHAGEMFFEVSADAQRPFVVEAGRSEVTVTGTRFNVRRDADQVRVSVQSGSVQVASGRWWNANRRLLTVGQQIVADGAQPLGEAAQVDIENIVAWQHGKIVFNNVPLAQVLDEMNRYLPQPVRLQAPGLREHRISGVLGIDDPQAMLQALPVIAPVRLVQLAGGQFRVLAR